MQEVEKDSVVLTTAKKEGKRRGGEDAKRHPEGAANEVPADDEDGRCASTSQSIAAKASSRRWPCMLQERGGRHLAQWRATPPTRMSI